MIEMFMLIVLLGLTGMMLGFALDALDDLIVYRSYRGTSSYNWLIFSVIMYLAIGAFDAYSAVTWDKSYFACYREAVKYERINNVIHAKKARATLRKQGKVTK